MKADYYVDSILGEWKPNKKKSTKDALCFTRSAKVVLHKDHAMNNPNDPDNMVHGEIILEETKLVNLKDSKQTFFRGLKTTKGTIKTPIIK